MKLGIISLCGDSSMMIVNEAAQYFKESKALDIRKLHVHLFQSESKILNVHYEKKPLEAFDCVYLRGSHKYTFLQRSISKALQNVVYLPIKPEAFTIGHNKLLTLLELQKNDIRIPRTYFAATGKGAKDLLEEVNFPIILKIPHGTQGKGVMIADSISSAKTMIDALEVFKQPYILQEYIETGSTDIRAIVVGNKVVAAMERVGAKDDIRSNIHAGGHGRPVNISPETEEIAIKAAKVIGADICGVDILEGTKPAVIEVNLSPGLKGITKALHKNIAKMIAQFLFERTKEFLEEKTEKAKPIEVKPGQEIYTTLSMKNGIIRLPKFVADISGFSIDDDVVLVVNKGKIEIKRHKIKKED